MDISDFIPIIAAHLGVAPSSLIFLLAIIHLAAKYGSKTIPDDATGFLGMLRRICAVVGVDPPSTITSGVTVTDVAKAALATPPIPAALPEPAAEALAAKGDTPAH